MKCQSVCHLYILHVNHFPNTNIVFSVRYILVFFPPFLPHYFDQSEITRQCALQIFSSNLTQDRKCRPEAFNSLCISSFIYQKTRRDAQFNYKIKAPMLKSVVG